VYLWSISETVYELRSIIQWLLVFCSRQQRIMQKHLWLPSKCWSGNMCRTITYAQQLTCIWPQSTVHCTNWAKLWNASTGRITSRCRLPSKLSRKNGQVFLVLYTYIYIYTLPLKNVTLPSHVYNSSQKLDDFNTFWYTESSWHFILFLYTCPPHVKNATTLPC